MARTRNRWVASGLLALPGAVAGALVGLVVGLGVGRAVGLGAAVVVCVVGWLFGRFAWPSVLIGILGAEPAGFERLPRVHNALEGLAPSMGLPLPPGASPPAGLGAGDRAVAPRHPRLRAQRGLAVRVVRHPVPVALALGDVRHGVVVATTGLEERLGPVELEAVLAHELAHLLEGEGRRAEAAAFVALPIALVSERASRRFVHLVAGRGREFRADMRALGATRYPPGLKAALEAADTARGAHGDEPPGTNVAARSLAWLWTSPFGAPRSPDELVGELDAPAVRIAALDEL
jgi:Zn-dependent protease with chaperone function